MSIIPENSGRFFPFHPSEEKSWLPYWIALSLVPRFSKMRLKCLAEFCEFDFEHIFRLGDDTLQGLGLDEEQIQAIKQFPNQDIERVQNWLSQDSGHFALTYHHPKYPHSLREISSPPLVIYGVGNVERLHQPQLAVVGSRNPTEAGKRLAFDFAKALTELGCGVTSGLALGIDSFAHKGALANDANTIAVLGSGIDVCYPKRNNALFANIVNQGGCIVSEFLPGTRPLSHHFPRRNRMVSGLSLGTLVVEAAIKSGSLITAYYALQQNREVFAIPGSVNNPLTQGGHHLIKQGAKLVESVGDILEEFSFFTNKQGSKPSKNIQKSEDQSLALDPLLDSVDYEATSVDLVARRSGLPISVVLTRLLEYELRGLVSSVPGGYVKLGD
ncbi:DNA-processing protein DprA [Alteromonas sp. a30]|uniref:DNA-processing protein DprA n=1 Tax=Alteromonas sp. a30 TaxID=2730917 RepID=UPI0022804624|nr:DNA-processing protein DprA [Alteromonas sp. a30]